MKRNVIYFVDEDDAARRANKHALETLLDSKTIQVLAPPPFSTFGEYNALIADPHTAAFVLDQRMKASGKVSYDGTDLAKYIRGIDTKMPIFILTGESDDDLSASEYLVEDILGKDQIEDVQAAVAKTIKARMLRRLGVFNDVREAQEHRFHELLLKSIRGELNAEEQAEMDAIEGETTAAVVAVERKRERELAENVEKLAKLIGDGKLQL